MNRPSPKDWKRLCAALMETEDPEAAAGLLKMPKSLVKRAWEKGWPSSMEDGEALPPIRQLVAQASVHGQAMVPVLAKAMSEEQQRYLQEALATNTARKALEGYVADQFLHICEKAMASGLRLAEATTELANRMAEDIRAAARNPELSGGEARSTLRTVASYLQKVSEVAEAYSRIRERMDMAESEAGKQATAQSAPAEELLERLQGVMKNLETMRKAKDALVIPKTEAGDGFSIPTAIAISTENQG